MTTGSSRRLSAVEESHPMQPISPLKPRPNASHPHGIKSAFKELFSKQKKKEKSDTSADVVIVRYSKKKAPVLPTPIATVTETVTSPNASVSRLPKVYGPIAEDRKKFYFDIADLEGGTPTEILPPSVLAAAPLSKSYQRKLHRKYSYSSLFTAGNGTLRKYTEPDLDRFSYTEPSLQRKFSSTTAATSSMNDVTDLTDEVTASSTNEISENVSKSQEKYSDFATEEVFELVERFEAAHGPNSADTDSYHTIHRMSMLPIVNPNSHQVAELKVNGGEMAHQLGLGSGHGNLLGTYSDIIEEISDLVPEQDLSPVPRLRLLKSNTGGGGGLRKSINNLQDLLDQMASETHLTESTFSAENISTYSRPEKVVVEEYFVEHWVPADDVPPESSGNGRTDSKNYETFEVSTPLSSVPSLIVEGDVSNSIGVAPHKIETESLSADILGGYNSDNSDNDENYGKECGEFIVSKVTRVLTLSRDNMVTNVGLKIEPVGKLDQRSAATLQRTLEREHEMLDLKRMDAEKSKAEISEIKISQTLLQPEDGSEKKQATKRRSGLTNFLNFLIHN
ncbi:hypothetical protein HK100_012347 [Physocladia obscura]|uniref:Uncharacterized protein n=1 Tax=Physocladia obscura TaxID=109957 RepID=A0AAD5XFZ2_9FUNG|nr:hypothetical protein HK100_012347 [Physocladia obscura]